MPLTKRRPGSFRIHAHRVSSWAACTVVTGAVLPTTGLAVSLGAGRGTSSGAAGALLGAGLGPTAGALLEPGAGTAAGALLGAGACTLSALLGAGARTAGALLGAR